MFNPATPLNWLDYVIDKIDLVLIMSVNPGFGGQKFIPEALGKLSEARRRIDAAGRDIRLEIDGGVKVENAAEIARAGADTFVVGLGHLRQCGLRRHHRGAAREIERGTSSAGRERRQPRAALLFVVVLIVLVIVMLSRRAAPCRGLPRRRPSPERRAAAS